MIHKMNPRRWLVFLAILAALAASFALTSALRDLFGQAVSSPEWIELYTAEGMHLRSVALFEDAHPALRVPKNPVAHSDDDCYFERLIQACPSGLIFVEVVSLPLMAAQGYYLPYTPSAPYTRLTWRANRARAPPVFL